MENLLEDLQNSDVLSQEFIDQQLLKCCSHKNNTYYVNLLIDYGANIHIYEDYPLVMSVMYENYDTVYLLIQKGADPNCRQGVCLSTAVTKGNSDIVKLLVDSGSDVNLGIVKSLTTSVINGFVHIFIYLIANGADINADDGAALHQSCVHNNYELTKLLLEMNADSFFRKNVLINEVAYYGYYDIVKLLLEHSYPITNSLFSACTGCHYDTVKLLLESGADVNLQQKDSVGRNVTPLIMSVRAGNINVIKLLLQYGAKYNQDEILKDACYSGDIDIFKFFYYNNEHSHILIESVFIQSINLNNYLIASFLIDNNYNIIKSIMICLVDTIMEIFLCYSNENMFRLLMDCGGYEFFVLINKKYYSINVIHKILTEKGFITEPDQTGA
ncbi:hypothetical protein QJ856_gp0736 [Tupanvirus deep ocean]|uniref:Uncharacterized protein n=2 Tax=Tupanvirus TaxID=2094720 RepID=A0AC62A8A9_9VIRU|nr:hypothetical protein QJ856_gp0736 [Tupanvirus deep ocean]QKU34016.1 hypothetical protein [Tupanvirus deep ocean]